MNAAEVNVLLSLRCGMNLHNLPSTNLCGHAQEKKPFGAYKQ